MPGLRLFYYGLEEEEGGPTGLRTERRQVLHPFAFAVVLLALDVLAWMAEPLASATCGLLAITLDLPLAASRAGDVLCVSQAGEHGGGMDCSALRCNHEQCGGIYVMPQLSHKHSLYP